MNRDQIKGVAKIVAGKVQEKAGKLIGSPKQELKGLRRQTAGQFQKGRGDIKKTIKDFRKLQSRGRRRLRALESGSG